MLFEHRVDIITSTFVNCAIRHQKVKPFISVDMFVICVNQKVDMIVTQGINQAIVKTVTDFSTVKFVRIFILLAVYVKEKKCVQNVINYTLLRRRKTGNIIVEPKIIVAHVKLHTQRTDIISEQDLNHLLN